MSISVASAHLNLPSPGRVTFSSHLFALVWSCLLLRFMTPLQSTGIFLVGCVAAWATFFKPLGSSAPSLENAIVFGTGEQQWDVNVSPAKTITGHLIFQSVSSLLQHWPNTRYRNGLSMTRPSHFELFLCVFLLTRSLKCRSHNCTGLGTHWDHPLPRAVRSQLS